VRGRPSRALARQITLPSLKYAATNFGAVLILGTDNLLIALALGTAAIPGYEAVARLVNTAMLVSLFAVTSSSPFVSNAYAAGDTGGVVRILLRNARLCMALMLTIVACLGVYGEQIVGLWLGPGRFVGYPVLIVFLVILTLEAHHVIHATVIMATGRVVFHWLALGAGLLSVSLSIALVRHLGLLGVVLGTLLAQVITNNWYVPYYTLRALGLSPVTYLLKVVAPLVLTFALMCATALFVRVTLGQALPPALLVVLGSGVTGLVGAIAIFLLVLEPPERRWLLRWPVALRPTWKKS
jgi:O-antigen/teichoic acid export membrane protein